MYIPCNSSPSMHHFLLLSLLSLPLSPFLFFTSCSSFSLLLSPFSPSLPSYPPLPFPSPIPPILPPARYSFSCSLTLLSINTIKKLPALLLKEDAIRLPEGIIIQSRNFRCMKLHIHPQNRYDADGLKELLEKKILVEKVKWLSIGVCVCIL